MLIDLTIIPLKYFQTLTHIKTGNYLWLATLEFKYFIKVLKGFFCCQNYWADVDVFHD